MAHRPRSSGAAGGGNVCACVFIAFAAGSMFVMGLAYAKELGSSAIALMAVGATVALVAMVFVAVSLSLMHAQSSRGAPPAPFPTQESRMILATVSASSSGAAPGVGGLALGVQQHESRSVVVLVQQPAGVRVL